MLKNTPTLQAALSSMSGIGPKKNKQQKIKTEKRGKACIGSHPKEKNMQANKRRIPTNIQNKRNKERNKKNTNSKKMEEIY